MRKTDHNKSEDKIISQNKINIKKINKKSEGMEKIPDFIMNKLPVNDIVPI